MESKSVCDCLNFIDSMILYSIEKHVGTRNVEDIRNFMIAMFNDKFIEDKVVMTGLLSQINLIVEKFYDKDDDSDLKREYWILRQHIIARLMEKNTKPEVDNDE